MHALELKYDVMMFRPTFRMLYAWARLQPPYITYDNLVQPCVGVLTPVVFSISRAVELSLVYRRFDAVVVVDAHCRVPYGDY